MLHVKKKNSVRFNKEKQTVFSRLIKKMKQNKTHNYLSEKECTDHVDQNENILIPAKSRNPKLG